MSRYTDPEHDPPDEDHWPDEGYWAAVGLHAPPETGRKDDAGRSGRRFLREVVETAVVAAVLFFVIQAMVQSYQVQGPSMEPSVHNNQLLLVNKAVYFSVARSTVDRFLPFVDLEGGRDIYPFQPPRRGDIVVLRGPDGSTRDFIKRIVAVPGDTVEISGRSLLVNGAAVDEPYVAELDSGALVRPVVIPPDHYYVLGDNRRVSSDSRSWGPVPMGTIIGKAWLRLLAVRRSRVPGPHAARDGGGRNLIAYPRQRPAGPAAAWRASSRRTR